MALWQSRGKNCLFFPFSFSDTPGEWNRGVSVVPADALARELPRRGKTTLCEVAFGERRGSGVTQCISGALLFLIVLVPGGNNAYGWFYWSFRGVWNDFRAITGGTVRGCNWLVKGMMELLVFEGLKTVGRFRFIYNEVNVDSQGVFNFARVCAPDQCAAVIEPMCLGHICVHFRKVIRYQCR